MTEDQQTRQNTLECREKNDKFWLVQLERRRRKVIYIYI